MEKMCANCNGSLSRNGSFDGFCFMCSHCPDLPKGMKEEVQEEIQKNIEKKNRRVNHGR